MMRSRDAWLTLFAAALGVDATSCRKQPAQPSGDAGSTEVVTATASIASAEPADANIALLPGVDASLAINTTDSGSSRDGGLRARVAGDGGKVDLSAIFGSGDASFDLSSIQATCGVSVNPACGLSINPRNNSCGLSLGTGSTGGIVGTPAPPVPHTDTTVALVSGEQPNDARVVAGQRPAMRACFNKVLTADPSTPDGRATLSISISANGEVSAVSVGTSTLPAADTSCIAHRFSNVQFDPAGSNRVLVITVVQKKVP